ncbi:MAG: hypothetical protein ACW97P_13590, partial [Candidatus Hodarchaeales archaeon]
MNKKQWQIRDIVLSIIIILFIGSILIELIPQPSFLLENILLYIAYVVVIYLLNQKYPLKIFSNINAWEITKYVSISLLIYLLLSTIQTKVNTEQYTVFI